MISFQHTITMLRLAIRKIEHKDYENALICIKDALETIEGWQETLNNYLAKNCK